ncbi:MAG: hypothetical protein M0C28_31735 [Candidatus Moduliflexus flocculans]|nr:hypothetical protein [Candidatus Moduliflexus flocculans]
MPKENTHLLFAHRVLEEFHETDILREVSGHLHTYLLGSVIPDTFYYSGRKPIERISETFTGRPATRRTRSSSRCSMQPATPRTSPSSSGTSPTAPWTSPSTRSSHYLSGNYYDEVPGRRTHAVYMHRHLETCLDKDLKNTFRIHQDHPGGLSQGPRVPKRSSPGISMQASVRMRRSLRKAASLQPVFHQQGCPTVSHRPSRAFPCSKTASHLGLFYRDVPSGECLPPTHHRG